jgi:hypothetical protein
MNAARREIITGNPFHAGEDGSTEAQKTGTTVEYCEEFTRKVMKNHQFLKSRWKNPLQFRPATVKLSLSSKVSQNFGNSVQNLRNGENS